MARRDNGLPMAASYAPLADVDPPLSDHVLDLLAGAGIPAYTEPLAGETGPYRDVRAPDRPTTRVYVDRAALDRAREVVGRTLPGLRADFLADAAARADRSQVEQAEVDARWAQIVAGYDDPGTAEPVPRWPVSEDLEPDEAGRPEPGEAGRPEPDGPGAAGQAGSGLSARLVRRAGGEPAGGATDEPAGGADGDGADRAAGGAPAAEVDDPEDHYRPPHPPPLPRPPDAIARFAWAGALGGPALVIAANLLGLEPWLAGLGVAAFIAGFVTLVARMKDRPPQDDGWDDGAVV